MKSFGSKIVDIFTSGKLSNTTLLIALIYTLGVVITNAHLSKYGAFSWAFLDMGYLSSGLIFTFYILVFLLPFLLHRKQQNNNSLNRTVIQSMTIQFYLSKLRRGDIFCISLLLPLVFLAYIFGVFIYGHIPKSLGGGKPHVVYLISDNEQKERKQYLLIDETPDSFILVSTIKQELRFLPKENNKGFELRYVNEKVALPNPNVSFVADLHINFPEADSIDKLLIKRIDTLTDYWRSINTVHNIILGDIMETPKSIKGKEVKKEDYVAGICAISKEIVKSGMTEVVIGNNDARNTEQLKVFKGFFPCIENQIGLSWHKELDKGIYGIALNFPDKKMDIWNDIPLFQANLDSMKVQLERVMKTISREYPYVLILTHQGFVRDSHWSTGFKKEDKDKLYKQHIKYWESYIGDVKEILHKYDHDNNRDSKSECIVVSGHYHKGSLIRSLDGIDHIICPSYYEGERDSKDIRIGSYPVVNLYFEIEEMKVEIETIALSNREVLRKEILYH